MMPCRVGQRVRVREGKYRDFHGRIEMVRRDIGNGSTLVDVILDGLMEAIPYLMTQLENEAR